MRLLKNFLNIVNEWRPAFCKEQAFDRVRDHAVASIARAGRGTITNLVVYLGRDQKDPSSDYKVYSVYKWNVETIFLPILKECISYCDDYIVVGVDDTTLKKTGKKIPGTSWGVDRMGPPFRMNLIWRLRFLQFSCLLPLHKKFNVQARAVPIRFVHAPPLKKPGKRATEEKKEEYKQAKKIHNLSTTFVEETTKLRKSLDDEGYSKKKLLIVGDGSFCNKTCMNINLPNTEIIARTRKNTKLCFREENSRRRIYQKEKFSPEDVRQNENISWKKSTIYYGGQWREIRFKEVKKVLWQSGTKTKELRLLVIAPLPYVKSGVRNYRKAAYLLCSDLEGCSTFLIQSYFDRWQIEVNFREEKSLLGVGQAQVRNPHSVEKQPAFVVCAYAALLLGGIKTYEEQYHRDFGEIPRWRDYPPRITCRSLIGLIRSSLLEDPVKITELKLTTPMLSSIFRQAA